MSENDLVDPPHWVTKELIQQALRDYTKENDLTISSFKIAGACRKGDNFSSIVSRVTCHVSSKEISHWKSLVVKTMPTWQVAVDYVTETKGFEKEMFMLAEVLPKIQSIMQEVGYTQQLVPKLYYSALEPQKIIIMEDLCQEGFYVPDRIEGLPLAHCKIIVRNLAIFHAASLVYFKRQPDSRRLFQKGQWGFDSQETTRQFLTNCLENIADNVDSWSSEKWSDKLRPLLNTLPDAMYGAYDLKDTKTPQVLNHGDVWTSNLMLKRLEDSKKDPEVRFLDFQISIEQSPVLDLMYFIFTSPENAIRFKEMETILKTYYEQFCEAMSVLQISVNYSYEDMVCDFKNKLIFGFSVFSSLFPLFLSPIKATENADVQKGSRIYQNPKFQESFLEGLSFFEKMGLF